MLNIYIGHLRKVLPKDIEFQGGVPLSSVQEPPTKKLKSKTGKTTGKENNEPEKTGRKQRKQPVHTYSLVKFDSLFIFRSSSS